MIHLGKVQVFREIQNNLTECSFWNFFNPLCKVNHLHLVCNVLVPIEGMTKSLIVVENLKITDGYLIVGEYRKISNFQRTICEVFFHSKLKKKLPMYYIYIFVTERIILRFQLMLMIKKILKYYLNITFCFFSKSL